VVGLVRFATRAVTSTAPTPAGLVTVHWLVLLQRTRVAAVPPKETWVPPGVLKPAPFSLSVLPPAAGTACAETPVMAGV
jgi:hypothetical protein